ncbi:MAG: hypothetical protein CTY24_05160, partial [Methylobacter sp.]
IKQVVISILKTMLNQFSTVDCKVYFNQLKLKQGLYSYRSSYQELTQTASNNLLAYVVLVKELQKLV